MHIVQKFGLIIWCCFLHIMLSVAEGNDQADVIKHCMNSTNSTSCSLTYEHVYKSLTKNENSFNISRALYPEGGKPSFLVRVNVYGPNKTHNSTPAQFIWSIHCLFSNLPALALEMLSLGSIIVTSRTQELDVQIPLFCCNLSENIERRKEMIQGFLTRALFEVSADFVWISKGRPVLPRGGVSWEFMVGRAARFSKSPNLQNFALTLGYRGVILTRNPASNNPAQTSKIHTRLQIWPLGRNYVIIS